MEQLGSGKLSSHRHESGSGIADECVEGKKGDLPMFILKVAYDGYNHQFRLIDRGLSHMFQDGEVYLLVVDFFPEPADGMDLIEFRDTDIGNA
jgi:hypothetical protein